MKKLLTTLVLVALLMGMLGVAAHADAAVELVFWHQYTDNPVMDNIAAEFMALHPDINVTTVAMATTDMNTTLKMALTSGTGPDLFYYDSGPGYLGAMAEAGLLMDLGAAAEQYGWKDRLAGWSLKSGTFRGALYGLGNEYEILCCYYNKAIFGQLGVEVPKTYAEFVAVCEKAKEQGIVGLVIDDMEKWPGYHYESLYYGAFGGPDMVQGALDQTLEGGFVQPRFAEGLDALADLVKRGLTSEFPNGISHDDSLRSFYSGGGAMFLTGTWEVNNMFNNMGDNAGMFIFPSAKDDVPTVPPVGVGSAMQVSKATKHPDETLMFLDYLFQNDGGAKTWMIEASAITPCDVDTSEMDLNPLFMQLLEIADATDVFNANIDVLMPQNVNDATGNYMQQVIDGMITGQQATELKQAALDEAKAQGMY